MSYDIAFNDGPGDEIGHPDTRRKLTAAGWFYLNADNRLFAWILAVGGVALPAIDEFVEGLEAAGRPSAAALRRRRALALALFLKERTGTMDESGYAGHVDYIINCMRAAALVDAVKPAVARTTTSDEAIRKAQPKGTAASKERAAVRREKLETAIGDYIANHPHALVRGINGLLSFLQERNLTFGYKDTSIEQYAKPLFAAARRKAKR